MFIDGQEYLFLARGNVIIDVRRFDGDKAVVASIGAIKTAGGMLQAFGRGHYLGHSEMVNPEDWLGADDATVKGAL